MRFCTVSFTGAATFRFDRDALDQLKLEARQKQINLNTLVNQIVWSHLEWDANAAKAGFIPVRKQLIRKLFDSLTKEQVHAIASSIGRELTDETMFIMAKRRTAESILELIERWIRISGFSYRYEMDRDDHHVYIIRHDMGMNWSLYLAQLFEEASSGLVTFKPDAEVTETAVLIRLKIG